MPPEGWVPIGNACAQNHKMSWRAKGLLAELLSYPDGYSITIDKLVAQASRESGGKAEGRDAMQAAMSELVRVGYAGYIRGQNERGHWTTEIAVCDCPVALADLLKNRQSVNRGVGKPGGRSTGDSVSQSVTRKTEGNTDNKTDENQRSEQQHSESLASLAVVADATTDDEAAELALKLIYERIDDLGDDGRRRALLSIERKRPKIYRDCRQGALAQLREEPHTLTGPFASRATDQLSLKYAAQHYAPSWPQWFLHTLTPQSQGES